jgi:hypothetical protein
MTRRDHEKFAREIKKTLTQTNTHFQDKSLTPSGYEIRHKQIAYAAEIACRVFEADNPSFSRSTFLDACGLKEEE